MRVLHVWDQGINYLLMRELEKMGVSCRMVASTQFDPFGMIDPKWKRDYSGSKLRLLWAINKESLRADVIHVHSIDKVVPQLAAFGNRVVLHYHGTDIRDRWGEREKYWRHANRILVSTRNLLEGAPSRAEFLPNPIDVDLFKPGDAPRVEAALHFNYGAVDHAEKLAKDHGLRLVVREKGVPYHELPAVMNGYTHYVDVKRDSSLRLLIWRPDDTGSMIGLQALACGLTALTLGGDRVGLPPMHHPHLVAKKLHLIYRELVE